MAIRTQTSLRSCRPTRISNQIQPGPPKPSLIRPSLYPAAQAYINTKLANGQPMIPSNASGEFFPAGSSTNNANELTAKIDFDLTSKDKLSATVDGNQNPVLLPFGDLPHVKIGAGTKPRVRFKSADLDGWIAAHTCDWRKA